METNVEVCPAVDMEAAVKSEYDATIATMRSAVASVAKAEVSVVNITDDDLQTKLRVKPLNEEI